MTTGVSQRLRSVEPVGCNELVSIDDITNIPRNTAIGGKAASNQCFFAESGRPVKSEDISEKKLHTVLNLFSKTPPYRRYFFCLVS
jgi:hypothetical protein